MASPIRLYRLRPHLWSPLGGRILRYVTTWYGNKLIFASSDYQYNDILIAELKAQRPFDEHEWIVEEIQFRATMVGIIERQLRGLMVGFMTKGDIRRIETE